MKFDIKKPSNILALIVLFISFYLLFIDPLLIYLNAYSLMDLLGLTSLESIGIFTVILLLITPFVWYFFVDKCSFKEIFNSLKLRSNEFDMAFVWGIGTAILMFITTIIFAFILYFFTGVEGDSFKSVAEIAVGISALSMLLIFIQTIIAEIYFRGFLLDKINSFAGKNIAIILTSLLYGLVHLSYGELYPAILPIFLGLILGYVVFKTKNLYSVIFAQIFFNIIVFILNYFAQALV